MCEYICTYMYELCSCWNLDIPYWRVEYPASQVFDGYGVHVIIYVDG